MIESVKGTLNEQVLSVEERAARGRAERAEVPRSSHGDFAPAGSRPDPIRLLERQAESRIPELVPIRYGRMLVSPFAFYRGAAAIMASDIAATPATALRTQLCGDAHASNFGVFASPERRLGTRTLTPPAGTPDFKSPLAPRSDETQRTFRPLSRSSSPKPPSSDFGRSRPLSLAPSLTPWMGGLRPRSGQSSSVEFDGA
jgi:hypothetical protein